MQSKKVESITSLITIIVELLCDLGTNYFIVNDPKLSHNLTTCTSSASVTNESTAVVSCKGTLCLML